MKFIVLIDNCENLLNDIEEYREMFPKSYTTCKGIINNLETPRKDLIYDGFNPGVFGISVADEWLDKCYTFEFIRKTDDVVLYRYLGLTKC